MGAIGESGRPRLGSSTPRAVAAIALVDARLNGPVIDHLPATLCPPDEAAAYDLQETVHQLLVASGFGPLAGHKIGCTTVVMQQYLGIGQPCAGGVFSSTVFSRSGLFTRGPAVRLGVECELAVTLGSDMPPRPKGYRVEEVVRGVAASHCAIEVVADRYVDYQSLDTPTLIADDFFNSGAVLGIANSTYAPTALAGCEARMLINGTEVGRGQGTDILGEPLEALAWLATMRAARGEMLRAGEFVLLGSMVQTQWVEPGDEVMVECTGLGSARARIE